MVSQMSPGADAGGTGAAPAPEVPKELAETDENVFISQESVGADQTGELDCKRQTHSKGNYGRPSTHSQAT